MKICLQEDQLKQQMRMRGPPFPYKVAKILDPAIYRNIEYDSWLEEKKGFEIFFVQERKF